LLAPEDAAAADLALIAAAAREAGAIAMRHFRNDPEVWMKNGTSPVSAADIAVDTFLRETLIEARPDYGWLSEETADSSARLEARRTFVVDPIDGTRAFIQGRRTWCVSIAVVEAGAPLAGVLECPAKGEFYEGRRSSHLARRGAGGDAEARALMDARRPRHSLYPLARLPHRHGGQRRARRHLRPGQFP
jgi:myo-inositol-1(or 4)-monophosphatase